MHGSHPLARRYCICVLLGMSITVLLSMAYLQHPMNLEIYNKVNNIFISPVLNFLNTRPSHNINCSKERNSSATVRSVSEPFSATQIHSCGPFLHRVRIFNEELDQLRLEALKVRGSGNWTPLAPKEQIKLLWTVKDDFFQYLGNLSQLKMVMLPWDKTAGTGRNWSSLNDTSNLLIQNYYEWTADDPLCKWIETPGTIGMKYDVTYNRTCVRDMSISAKYKSLNNLVLNAKPINRALYWPNDGKSFPEYFYTEQPPFAFYIYIIRDGIATDVGDVYTGNLKLVQYACSADRNTVPPSNIDKIPLHEEVYSIPQFWGTAKFHRMVEIIPRLALSLEFLKRNPHIKIHAPETGGRTADLVRILGLNETRLISGMLRAKLIFLPRSSMCGFANIQEIQVLSMLYRKYIEANFPVEPRNKLVLIRRSGSRRFTKQTEIEKVVEAAAKAHNLSYVMFKDNPVPSLNDTMRMFHSAVMVVAPHGAGLTNLVFSQPGTYVIEGVCNLPHVNFCFQRLAYVLGHHWHGTPSRGGCEGVVDVPAENIEKAVARYFDLMQNLRTK